MKVALFLTLIAVVVGDTMILNGEEPNSQANCARVCAGTTVRQKTNWIDYLSQPTGIYTNVDISKCGFTKIPTITTAIEGNGHHWAITGTSALSSVQRNPNHIPNLPCAKQTQHKKSLRIPVQMECRVDCCWIYLLI